MPETTLKLGKLPARPDAVKLKLSTYAKYLPAAPASFGWDYLIKPDGWGMLANDQLGDCVIAGGLHETLLWRRATGHTTPLSDACAVANYSAITGYDPDDPATDAGADMQAVASYRRKTGLADSAGHRHKIGAYVAANAEDIEQIRSATWLFGAVGIGIEFPAYAFDLFDQGKPWDIARTNTKIEGGHYLSLVGAQDGNLKAVTWGRVVLVTPRFLAKYCDENTVCFSEEMLTHGASLDHVNRAQLLIDLHQVTAA